LWNGKPTASFAFRESAHPEKHEIPITGFQKNRK
jgi:hypothetical protein